jgi:hypothetical protein
MNPVCSNLHIEQLSNLELYLLVDALIEQANKSHWLRQDLQPIDNYILKVILSRYFYGTVIVSKIIKTSSIMYSKEDVKTSLEKLKNLNIIFVTKKTISGKQKSICLPNLAHPNIQEKRK